MLLAIDVGNSETAVALFEGERLLHHWRLTSSPRQTGDEISVLLHYVLSSVGRREAEITGMAVSSVVPALTTEYRRVGERLLGRPTFILDHTTVLVPILYHDPASVGADRLANALAVIHDYGAPAVVVDLGTATTFDVVTAGKEYAGGVIAPGLATAANALFLRGARLAPVEIRRPERIMGRTTEEAMQAGIYYGSVGGMDALVQGDGLPGEDAGGGDGGSRRSGRRGLGDDHPRRPRAHRQRHPAGLGGGRPALTGGPERGAASRRAASAARSPCGGAGTRRSRRDHAPGRWHRRR